MTAFGIKRKGDHYSSKFERPPTLTRSTRRLERESKQALDGTGDSGEGPLRGSRTRARRRTLYAAGSSAPPCQTGHGLGRVRSPHGTARSVRGAIRYRELYRVAATARTWRVGRVLFGRREARPDNYAQAVLPAASRRHGDATPPA